MSHPSRIGRMVFKHHMTRQRPSLAVGLPSSVLHGKWAMKQEGTQANRERPALPLRVVIEGHCGVIFLLAR